MTKDEQIKMLKEQRAVLRASNEKFRKGLIDKVCEVYCDICKQYNQDFGCEENQECSSLCDFRKAVTIKMEEQQ